MGKCVDSPEAEMKVMEVVLRLDEKVAGLKNQIPRLMDDIDDKIVELTDRVELSEQRLETRF